MPDTADQTQVPERGMVDPPRLDTVRDEPESWQTVSSSDRFTGRVFALRSETVRMVDGQFADRDYLVHPGAVGVLTLDEDDRVLLIRQYRHPVRHQLWELPAGLLDQAGEPPLRAASRELREEAGYRALDWRVLVDMAMTPGSSDEAVRVFLARQPVPDPDGEFVREHEEAGLLTAWVPRTALVRAALAGEVHNGLLLAGVLALTAALAGEGLDALRPAEVAWPMRPF